MAAHYGLYQLNACVYALRTSVGPIIVDVGVPLPYCYHVHALTDLLSAHYRCKPFSQHLCSLSSFIKFSLAVVKSPIASHCSSPSLLPETFTKGISTAFLFMLLQTFLSHCDTKTELPSLRTFTIRSSPLLSTPHNTCSKPINV